MSAHCASGGRLALETPLLADQLVHLLHTVANGFAGGALQVRIERGVHAERARLKIGILKLGLQEIVHQVDKIRRFGGLCGVFSDCQRSIHGDRVIAVAHVAVLPHQR